MQRSLGLIVLNSRVDIHVDAQQSQHGFDVRVDNGVVKEISSLVIELKPKRESFTIFAFNEFQETEFILLVRLRLDPSSE